MIIRANTAQIADENSSVGIEVLQRQEQSVGLVLRHVDAQGGFAAMVHHAAHRDGIVRAVGLEKTILLDQRTLDLP